MARIHERMPAIVARENYARWLDPALRDPVQAQAMIASYPGAEMQAVPVSAAINNARNQGAALIEPAGEPLA